MNNNEWLCSICGGVRGSRSAMIEHLRWSHNKTHIYKKKGNTIELKGLVLATKYKQMKLKT